MINKYYLNLEIINKIVGVINKEGKVQLQKFLSDIYYKELLCNIKNLKLKKKYKPELYKYDCFNIKDKKLILLIEYFLFEIFKKKVKFHNAQLFLFKHNNYTLLNDNINETNGINVILELTEKWNKKYGGYTSFIKNNQEILRINPVKNSLNIIITDDKMKSFVKYVNHKTKDRKRIFIELSYKFL